MNISTYVECGEQNIRYYLSAKISLTISLHKSFLYIRNFNQQI